MNFKLWYKNEASNLKGTDKNLNIVIIFTTIVLFLYCYVGSFSAYQSFFAGSADIDYWAYIYHNAVPIVLFFVSGLLLIKFVLKGKLKDYGLGAGKWKLGLIVCAVGTPIIIGLGFLTALTDPAMAAAYPLTKYIFTSPIEMSLLYYVTLICYYIGWEFLFRGLNLFSLEKKTGALTAILLTMAISTLIHTSIAGFGKPLLETLSAIAGGLIFGFVAYKTRSIWYSFYLHLLLGFMLDMAIIILH